MTNDHSFGDEILERALAGTDPNESPLTYKAVVEPRVAAFASWPEWVAPEVIRLFTGIGIEQPWSHQAAAADAAFTGRHVVVSTGTASGKSVAYQLPILTGLLSDSRATALYISPTKALASDQIRSIVGLMAGRAEFTHIAPCAYDGDTDPQIRQWARENSRWLFTNPDMLHLGILSGHARWRRFLRNLRYIVIDECHHYRGVFGSHVALVYRRLLRLARAAGGDPIVIGASATVAQPGAALSRLIGEKCVEVTEDGSPHGAQTVALWEPPFVPELRGENDAPVRRPAGSEAARLLADLVLEGARTLCFVRSRRGVELTSLSAKQILGHIDPALAERVGAYRAGYLADDRHAIEHAIADGALLGVATTNALELGVDISGLDAVIIAGYPGTVASFWQQSGRAGRRGEQSLVVLVARDDPLDTYLVRHPEALLERPVEATILDPSNPHVLGPHLLCAATELPLTETEVDALGAREIVDSLTAERLLRRRKAGWYPAAGITPHADIDIRGGIGGQVMIVDTTTSELLGTTDTGRAMSTVHPGAVHIHQGRSFVVDELDLDDGLALVHPEEPEWTTTAREVTHVDVTAVRAVRNHEIDGPGALPQVTVQLVDVDVTHQVVGYLRKLPGGEVLDSVELDMHEQTLSTRAVMYTVDPEALEAVGVSVGRIPGALHAAEHSAIGLMPLIATCDRSDIGGLSTNLHPDTGLPSVFVYDGLDGGAGFADRGFEAFGTWIAATREAVAACRCEAGCPSCVQSPKCGNGNAPLDKDGAVRVLDLLLRAISAGEITETAITPPA
ncbi:DEAD/DEAH box helicase [Gordonia jinhuaensis]|uniref:ATP-dependent RNA helicase, DEAD/DEAH box family protein n=1 Tax=Gordonia jinhuaensis TaxID=1517702 RepID=A0A916WWR6_9ACTN|nr:DEAD/DEAH box helicase [Gordonia jinhuaensis]GGB35823.1 ATP-dependent RNA helicase, DEAD/DEAH box family protein [Gordonia jinhuaensis]